MEYIRKDLVLYEEGKEQLEHIKDCLLTLVQNMTLKQLDELKEKGIIKVEEKMWTTPGGNIVPITEYTFKI